MFDAVDLGTIGRRRDNSCDEKLGGPFTASFADHPGAFGPRNRDIPLLHCSTFALLLGLPGPIHDPDDLAALLATTLCDATTTTT